MAKKIESLTVKKVENGYTVTADDYYDTGKRWIAINKYEVADILDTELK